MNTKQFPVPTAAERTTSESLPPLEPGDHLDQKTFHERYKAMPPGCRAELIGGVVFMPSPLKRPHSRMHGLLHRWIDEYEEATPGTESHLAATTILDDEAELEPDVGLLIVAANHGQTREEDGYIVGARSYSPRSRRFRRPSTCTANAKTTNDLACGNTSSWRCGSSAFTGSPAATFASGSYNPAPMDSFAPRCSPVCGSIPRRRCAWTGAALSKCCGKVWRQRNTQRLWHDWRRRLIG